MGTGLRHLPGRRTTVLFLVHRSIMRILVVSRTRFLPASTGPGTRQIVLSLLLLLFPCLSYAQPFHFKHIGPVQGLSQVTVNAICQDASGYLWFGTQDGLNRYDGYTFVQFKSDPAKVNSLSHSWIWDIFEDSNRNLWVATWSGLNRISPDRTTITRYYPDPEEEGTIRGERPVSVVETSRGNLWVGTWGGGLNLFDPKNEAFTVFSSAIDSTLDLPGDYIRKLWLDDNGQLWIGTWSGLWIAEQDGQAGWSFRQFDPGEGLENSELKVTSFCQDGQGNTWCGTLGQGIFRMKDSGKEAEQYTMQSSRYPLISDQVSGLVTDHNGRIWVGTVSSGVSILDFSLGTVLNVTMDPADPVSLGSNSIHSMFMDQSGLIWLGTDGLSMYDPALKKFNSIGKLSAINRDMENIQRVTALFEDAGSRIWAGSDEYGLFLLRNKVEEEEDSWLRTALAALETADISAVVQDDQGMIWVGTRGNGLIRISPENKVFINQVAYPDNPNMQGINYINGLAYQSPSSLWIATYDQGLIRYDTQSRTYTRYANDPADHASFPANYLLRVYTDSRNTLWVCTWGAGIIHFDPQTETWKGYTSVPGDTTSLSDNIVHTFTETNRQGRRYAWVGTRKGLSCIDPSGENGIIASYYPSDGLPGNVVNAIVEDGNGALWISTNSGLCRFSPDSGTFRNYDVHDGLQGNEFNAGAGLRLHDGRLMFGGINGFNIFYPDSISASHYNPPVVITQMKIFEDEIGLDPGQTSLQFDYQENFLSFEFASLDFSQPLKNKYRYRMEGVDREWVYAGDRRFASYTDLSPGRYTFRVEGTNADGRWSEKMAELHVVISPPYWQAWWFRLFITGFLVLLVYIVFNYRLRRIREIEKLRVRIASDLHDDIGASLTHINIHTQQIRQRVDHPGIRNSLDRIGDLSREVISTMSDIVWSIDARNDSTGDLVARMKDYAFNTLVEQEISVDFKAAGFEKNRKMDIAVRQNIFSIFKEAVNNIIKHAAATEVSVYLDNTGNRFEMRISDNGKGFDTGSARKGNGLGNMQMRAERMGGTIRVVAQHNVAEGTSPTSTEDSSANRSTSPQEDHLVSLVGSLQDGNASSEAGTTSLGGTTIELTMKSL